MQLVYLHLYDIESPKSEFCSSISRSSGVRGRCRGVHGAPRAQSLQNSRLHAAAECRIVLPRAERRTKWQIGTSSSGRTADSGSVNGSSTLSVPAILPSQLHMWPVRLAVQDAALSRRRSGTGYHLARSSSGSGRRPLKAEITSSNLVRATKTDFGEHRLTCGFADFFVRIWPKKEPVRTSSPRNLHPGASVRRPIWRQPRAIGWHP